jgi:outer membrane immunogenic protein
LNKITACVAAIAALIAAPAFAAPLPPPAPVYTWTGWYVGGNVGYSWGDADSDLNGAGTATSQIEPGGFKGFPFPIQFNGGSDTVRLKGAIGGAQVGYNYQVNSLWVLGLESDFQISGERGSSSFVDPFSSAVCTLTIVLTCVGNPRLNGLGRFVVASVFCLVIKFWSMEQAA